MPNNDLISRSALLEELRKGVIITADIYGMGITEGLSFAIRSVAAAPAVDAVEVVRCVDCVRSGETTFDEKMRYCRRYREIFGENDFCSYGERRDKDA